MSAIDKFLRAMGISPEELQQQAGGMLKQIEDHLAQIYTRISTLDARLVALEQYHNSLSIFLSGQKEAMELLNGNVLTVFRAVKDSESEVKKNHVLTELIYDIIVGSEYRVDCLPKLNLERIKESYNERNDETKLLDLDGHNVFYKPDGASSASQYGGDACQPGRDDG